MAFKESSVAERPKRFEAMSRSYAAKVRTWNLWRIVEPVLQACGKELDEVAFLNCFPYRTAEDRKPYARALRASWSKAIGPLLMNLEPATVVALGMKAGRVATHRFLDPDRIGRLYVVPRTTGDGYISSEARVVLDALTIRTQTRKEPS